MPTQAKPRSSSCCWLPSNKYHVSTTVIFHHLTMR